MALTNPQETIDERPVCCTYASGRVFYGLKNNIYYSQIMEGESIDKLSRCYQQNDPTSERLSDLLDTDGGTLQVGGASSIIQLAKFRTGVLIYSTNGIWYLSGPDTGFTATNFFLNQVSTTGCVSPESVVAVEDVHYFWGQDGIFVVSENDFGRPQVSSVVENTLQSFYNDIPLAAKKKSYGCYNSVKKQVEWHYASTAQSSGTSYRDSADKSLVLDTRAGGLWPQEYNSVLEEASGNFIGASVNTTQSTEDLDEVKVIMTMGAPGASTQNYSITFANKSIQSENQFADFAVAYPAAYIETGYETLDKPSNKKSAPYIVTHFLQTEQNWVSDGAGGFEHDFQSGCTMRAKWDWNNSSANGRWSPPQQAYRFSRTFIAPDVAGVFDSGERVITTKSKMLGRGKALSIRFEQVEGKDMQVLGYTTLFSVKGKV